MTWKRQHGSLTTEELQGLLDAQPSDHLAFVSARSSERTVAETLVAMANANGGTVLLGVTSKGAPQPDVEPAALRDRAVSAGLLSDPPLILPSPHVVGHPQAGEDAGADAGAQVVVVQVPAGLPHLYSVRGRYLTRTAGQNRPLTTPELRQLLLDRGDSGFEESTVAGATLTDLDARKVERYLDRIGAAPDEDALQVLLARGCVAQMPAENTSRDSSGDSSGDSVGTEYVPTVAGVLLFGHEPRRFLRSAEVICVRYTGDTMGDEFVRQDVYGSLPEQARQAEAFVTSNMHRGMRIAGMAREDTAEYPTAVVREAIVNAIAHRDYSIRGEGIRVLMFSDRLEVYSPGRLPGHVTLDNLIDERYSRNEAIVAVLTDLGYIERLGYGIDRMIATMKEAGLPAPLFEETPAGFKVTLRSAEVTPPEESSAPRSLPPELLLNERQEAALAYVQEHSRITNSDYQALVPDVSAETIRRDLADLVEKNLLIRIGNKRATYYILK